MVSLIERFNQVAMTKSVPLETIDTDKKYNLLMVSQDDDRRGARVVLSLMLGDTLGLLYMPSEFTNVFTQTDIWNINNDRVKYGLSIVNIDSEHPRKLRLELAEHV